MAAKALGLHFATSAFDGASEKDIGDMLEKAALTAAVNLCYADGRTGVHSTTLSPLGTCTTSS